MRHAHRFTRSFLSFVTLTALAALANGAQAQLTTNATVIVGKGSGKCLNVAGGSTADGAQVIQWNCVKASNELWTLEPYADAFRVVAAHSGKCMNVSGGSTANGAVVIQYPCVGANNELWTPELFNGFWRLRAKHSGRCLNVPNARTDNNAQLIQWDCVGADNELWTFGDAFVPNATRARHASLTSGLCMDVLGGSTNAAASVIQWTCGTPGVTLSQNWSFQRAGSGGGYRMVAQHSGQCLSVLGGSNAEDAQLVQWPCADQPWQLWVPTRSGSTFQWKSAQSGKCIIASGGSTAAGTGLVQHTCGSATTQLWRVSTQATLGGWSDIINMPIVPVAAAMLKNGKVMTWASNDAYSFDTTNIGVTQTALFDPATNTAAASSIGGVNMFCPGTALLPDGRLVVNGGISSPSTTIYDPTGAGGWLGDRPMNIPRGYNADATLDDGSVFTIGGSFAGQPGRVKSGERWSVGSGWTSLPGADAGPMTGGPDPQDQGAQGIYRGDNHSWLFQVGSGTVFQAGPSAQMNWYNANGSGGVNSAGNRGSDPYSMNGNAVMFDAFKILKVGGAPAYDNVDATKQSYVINLNSGVSVTQSGSMTFPRSFHSSVVLPDGRVLTTGGQSHAAAFNDSLAVMTPEIWNPSTGVYSLVASMSVPRDYHSWSLLLPDARVLVGGGGLCGPCDSNHADLQIYSPDYLFQSGGQAAVRPVINTVPASFGYGTTISVTTNSAVSSFVLVRMGSVTHTVNNDQRRVPLTIASSSGTNYTVRTPANAGLATPGYYMLYAINSTNVPSVSKIVQVH